MKLLEATAIFYVLAKNNHKPSGIVKVAFDTRRIDQETQYNPRRGLQYYHRSEGFIKKNTASVVNAFIKLKKAVDELKDQYLGSPQWLDSNCRVLSANLDRILRIKQGDQEFFDPQLNYLEELIDVRYRLKLADIDNLETDKLKNIVLSKDEELSNAVLCNNYDSISTSSNKNNAIQVNGIDQLIKELLGTVRASDNDPEVERSITISIKDKIVK